VKGGTGRVEAESRTPDLALENVPRAQSAAPSSPYLTVEAVAARLHCSPRKVHELTRLREIPHRRLPGARRCLFLEAELAAWEGGAELEVVELPRGGRVVRPKGRL
jgi:excisionase family DNA binding protein